MTLLHFQMTGLDRSPWVSPLIISTPFMFVFDKVAVSPFSRRVSLHTQIHNIKILVTLATPLDPVPVVHS